VEEVGAMNIFFVSGNRLLTPPLTGSFLEGITRDSILRLAPTLGLSVDERPIAVDELLAEINAGRIQEAFGCGTAAVVSPVAAFGYRDELVNLGSGGVGGVGKVTQLLYDTLTGIQYGRIPDPFGWMHKV